MKFEIGEHVLCFHGPLLYDAKCLQYEEGKGYLIHYAGWNKNWDEWVSETRILKNNEESVKRQADLLAAYKLGKQKAARCFKSGRRSNKTNEDVGTEVSRVSDTEQNTGEKHKFHKLHQTVETEEQYASKIEIKIKIPDELRAFLVDDWDVICRQNKIVSIPTQKTVQDILNEFVESKEAAGVLSDREAIIEFISGLREYFNVMLSVQLLYRFERPQLKEVTKKYAPKPVSEIYGCIHLLRMFVKIGGMLAYTTLGEKDMSKLISYMQAFLKFLVKNPAYFTTYEYVDVSEDYKRAVDADTN